MLKEFASFLFEQGGRAERPHFTTTDDPRRELLTFRGEKEWIATPPDCRNHEVWLLDDLALAIEQFGAQSATIFHGYGEILCQLDSADRRDRVAMPLRESEQIAKLRLLRAPRAHKAFVQLLRLHLSAALPDGFLETVRSVEFSRTDKGSAAVSQGKETLGRNVEAVVESSIHAVPDRITLTLSYYANRDLHLPMHINAEVVIDAETQMFSLYVSDDALTWMLAETHEQITAMLKRLTDAAPGDVTILAGRAERERADD